MTSTATMSECAQVLPSAIDELSGTRRLRPDHYRIQRFLVLAVTVLPTIGVFVAGVVAWRYGFFSVIDAVVFTVMYLITGFGITIGFHRLCTHGGFEAPAWIRGLLAVSGSMALQGPVIRWVADHRRHHAHSDEPGDPHSPHLEEGEGLRAQLRGLWHSHMGWLFSDEKTTVRAYAPDLLRDRVILWVDAHYGWWVALTLVMPTLLAFALTGTWLGALSGLLWGGFVRIFLLHHVTWSINSICHVFGNRPFETRDRSTNNWLLAIPSLGESWHNNHHAHPKSAFHGLHPWQIDASGLAILALARLRLVKNVRRTVRVGPSRADSAN